MVAPRSPGQHSGALAPRRCTGRRKGDTRLPAAGERPRRYGGESRVVGSARAGQKASAAGTELSRGTPAETGRQGDPRGREQACDRAEDAAAFEERAAPGLKRAPHRPPESGAKRVDPII